MILTREWTFHFATRILNHLHLISPCLSPALRYLQSYSIFLRFRLWSEATIELRSFRSPSSAKIFGSSPT